MRDVHVRFVLCQKTQVGPAGPTGDVKEKNTHTHLQLILKKQERKKTQFSQKRKQRSSGRNGGEMNTHYGSIHPVSSQQYLS